MSETIEGYPNVKGFARRKFLGYVGAGTGAVAVSGSFLGTQPTTAAAAAFSGTRSLSKGWALQTSTVATASGAEISQPGYTTTGWFSLSAPETLMAGLLDNGRYRNIFYSDNLKSVSHGQFDVPWWYRAEFRLRRRPGEHTFLIIDGVASRADLWINGTKIANHSHLQGSYAQFEYDITPYTRDGANAVAVRVFKNNSDKYLTLDMVDWNQPSPDEYTGLQFTPKLARDGSVSLRDAHIVQQNSKDLRVSDLTVSADLRNNTKEEQRAVVTGAVKGRHTRVTFSKFVRIPAGQTRTITIGRNEQSGLRLRNPEIWWPYQMGDQPLYDLDVDVTVDGNRSDATSTTFAIRTVTSHLTQVVDGKTYAPKGYRQFVINGSPFVIRGAGWSQDMFLRYSHDDIADQISYIKNMGLNTIRFEGNFPPDDLFNQLDRAGVLAMTGWQCCDKWQSRSTTWSDETKANAKNQARHVARWLRRHPSVFTFFLGSDNAPGSVAENIYLDAFHGADWETPLIAAAEYKSSPQLGTSGCKEGPYNYAPPAYWWNNGPESTSGGGNFTNTGSAWGYDTETSAGNTVPTQDSLNRFMTTADQEKIWDPKTTHGKGSGDDIYHTSPYGAYTTVARMGAYNTPLWHRYGHWSDMVSYQKIAQAGGYEVTRAQFEAYIGHSKDRANPSTGVIYWMMNKAWPSLQWNLYNYDFDQAGVYFGAKKANEPLHIMYDYHDGSIKVANLKGERQAGLQVTAEFVDIDGSIERAIQTRVRLLPPQDIHTVATPSEPHGISTTYFLKLVLHRGRQIFSRNVYWLSTKGDRVDWKKTLGRGSGAVMEADGYADLTGLHDLRSATVQARANTRIDGNEAVTTVKLRNTSDGHTPAFFARVDVHRSKSYGTLDNGDNQILPIRWNDNDVTFWPGEDLTLTGRYHRSRVKGIQPVVSIAGWNVSDQVIPAPKT